MIFTKFTGNHRNVTTTIIEILNASENTRITQHPVRGYQVAVSFVYST